MTLTEDRQPYGPRNVECDNRARYRLACWFAAQAERELACAPESVAHHVWARDAHNAVFALWEQPGINAAATLDCANHAARAIELEFSIARIHASQQRNG